jgi:hypothetical protein
MDSPGLACSVYLVFARFGVWRRAQFCPPVAYQKAPDLLGGSLRFSLQNDGVPPPRPKARDLLGRDGSEKREPPPNKSGASAWWQSGSRGSEKREPPPNKSGASAWCQSGPWLAIVTIHYVDERELHPPRL